jgi:hypothetical protein
VLPVRLSMCSEREPHHARPCKANLQCEYVSGQLYLHLGSPPDAQRCCAGKFAEIAAITYELCKA